MGLSNDNNDYSTILLDEPLADIQNLNIDLTGYNVNLEVYSGSNLIINVVLILLLT